MSIRQRLDIRQSQSLVMTPQLQQAIKLLQLSNIELAEFVDAEIERNPLLERGEREDAPEAAEKDAGSREELALDDRAGLNEAREALDAPTEDVYESGTGSDTPTPAASGPSASTDWSKAGSGKGIEDFDFEGVLTGDKSLREHLHDQVNLSPFSPAERLIAVRLVEETDEAGYCRADLDEVAQLLGAHESEVAAVLSLCQGFEPTGVMARTVPECLGLQLADRDRLDPAMQALLDNLNLVAKHDIRQLCEVTGCDKQDVLDMMSELRALTPRPGSGFAGDTAIAVAPDVFVRELPNGMFAVELNADTLPRVLMDKAYYAEVSALPMRDAEKEFITECATNANWLIKSLDQRART
ncbi:MAG: RNA polymerase sigma-54 factor, partial [Pseudomonadota bacterium]